MTADYNGWADRPEEEREAEDAAEARYAPAGSEGGTRPAWAATRSPWCRLPGSRWLRSPTPLRGFLWAPLRAGARAAPAVRPDGHGRAAPEVDADAGRGGGIAGPAGDAPRPALEALGRQHVGYGVEDRHYGLVGEALLWTLEQGLGDGYTRSVREAWTAAYTTLATIMRDAAADGREAA